MRDMRPGPGPQARLMLAGLMALASGAGAAPGWAGAGGVAAQQATSRPAGRAATGAGPAAEMAAPGPVNVFIFLIDTLRADRLGTYGYRAHDTSPHIDALAEHGVVFEQAYAAGPWTPPSVASLFTSTFPCEHNMLCGHDRLADSADTLAERMKRAGLETYCCVANGFVGPKFGLAQGFEVFAKGDSIDGPQVSEVLGDTPGRPFFFYLHNMEPHTPYLYAPPTTPGFRTISDDVRRRMESHFKSFKVAAEFDYRRKLPLGTNDRTAEQDVELAALNELRDDWSELYDAAVRYGDTLVGSTIEMLKRRGLWDDTLFILVADHGEEFNDHGNWLHDQSVYEELMHIPLIMRFPRDRFAGRRIKDVVSLVDVLPTIIDYLERPDLAEGARGSSLLPLIRGDTSARAEAFAIPGMRLNRTRYYQPWETTRGDVNIVIRRGAWKGIWNADIDALELYDLGTDPRELKNVAAEHPRLVEALHAYAEAWLERCQELTGAKQDAGELDEETLRKLRSLGYID